MQTRFNPLCCSSLLIVAFIATSALSPPAAAQAQLRTYRTKYYLLHTDLDERRASEAIQRITLMAEEYYRRTRDFGGSINERLPFFLFSNPADYYANGGIPGSAGVFMGDRLMAIVGDGNSGSNWHVVQHEGFHQFVHAAIGGSFPPWVNEGMAEYFGDAIFTGDGFVTGVVSPQRLATVRAGIENRRFKPLFEMMQLDQAVWNLHVMSGDPSAGANYLQAWAMVYFLAQADGGKYQQPFTRFISDVSRGKPWEDAWTRHFGRTVGAFQQRWEDYWRELPDNPTDDLYARATVETMTSFFARAFSQRQYFDTFEEFRTAAEAGQIQMDEKDWLPQSLLEAAVKRVPEAGEWSIRKIPGRKSIVCELADGTKFEGTYRVDRGRVKSVDVKKTEPRKKK